MRRTLYCVDPASLSGGARAVARGRRAKYAIVGGIP